MTSLRRSVALILFTAMTAVACGKKAPVETPQPPPPAPPPAVQPKPTPPPPPPPPRNEPPPPPRVPTDAEIFASWSLDQLNEKGLLVDVYFAYDVADLSDQARGSLGKNADVMKKWPTTRVMVEGHADARGTSEYNMALGERRASAIRDYLVSLGIAAARVTIVSKGEEEPSCRDEAESCWSLNRRGRFFFTAK
jgi:peptidoglycan-associated lipoprotein